MSDLAREAAAAEAEALLERLCTALDQLDSFFARIHGEPVAAGEVRPFWADRAGTGLVEAARKELENG